MFIFYFLAINELAKQLIKEKRRNEKMNDSAIAQGGGMIGLGRGRDRGTRYCKEG